MSLVTEDNVDTVFNAASMAIFEDGRVLLIRRARSPFLDYWSLPGGRREPGETAVQCAIREVAEETGLSAFSAELVEVIDIGQERPFFLAVFASDDYEGIVTGSDEISGHVWSLVEYLPRPVTPELPDVLAKARAVLARRG
ncbi:MAG: NUDIX domain-containing protein [Devosia nanyangense]|nr:NUDIX domain-containing protein [Devosia nanyangense]